MRKFFLLTFLFCAAYSNAQQDFLSLAEVHLYSNSDSAYFYLDKLYKQSIENKEYIQAVEALTYINYTSSYHGDFGKFKASLQKEDALFKKLGIRIDSLPDGLYYTHYYWYDKGTYFYLLNDYNRARPYFFRILNSTEKMADSLVKSDFSAFVTGANNYLATMYRQELKYALAEEFYNENLRLHEKFGDSESMVYDTRNLLASLEAARGEYETSNCYAKDALKYYSENGPENNFNSFLSTSFLLVNNYLALKKPDSAEIYLERIAPLLMERKRFIPDFHELSGDVQKQKKEVDAALEYYKLAIEGLINGKENADEIALLYKKIGDLYFQDKKNENALSCYYRAIDLYQVTENKNPQSGLKANNITGLLHILNAAGKAELKAGTTVNHHNNLQYGLLGIEKLKDLRRGFYNESDKQILAQNLLPIFENALASGFELYQYSKNKNYIDTLFTLIENSKSSILIDALYKNNATKFAGVPENVLQKEQILKIEIARLEKQLNLEKDSLASAKLFQARRKHEKLVDGLEQKHPKYYNLKYNSEVKKLPELKDALEKGQLAISYFYGSENVYATSIGGKNKKTIKIPVDKNDSEKLLKLQKLLSSPKTDITEILQISYSVYSKFVEPLLPESDIKKLLIMPDGALRAIPFGSLVIEENKPIYLLENFSISYSNSATLWFQLQHEKANNNSVLAFAPDFSKSSQFTKLPNNQREVEQISRYFKADIFKDAHASLQNFKKHAGSYGIIHLATHAQTNDEFPEYSFLAFTPTKKTENLLYINDLYNLKLDAGMVCLSACETGVGELHRGEGFISLARAFYYAGAKSLVNSLWKIEDRPTSEIMAGFYQYLQEGKTKGQALQAAKLDFLKKHREDAFSHPYYWSGLIVSGNTDTLVQKTYYWWLFAGGLLLIVIILIIAGKLFKLF